MDYATATSHASTSDPWPDGTDDDAPEATAPAKPAPAKPAPAKPAEAGHPDAEFIEALLAALTGMAVRSPRRQADLAVALRRSGIEAPPSVMRRALYSLEQDGCIERLVPLNDGGLLLQVTGHGIERVSQTTRRHVLDFTPR